VLDFLNSQIQELSSAHNTKAVINRLSKAIGHLESVKKMVEVLIQIAAVKSAVNNIGKIILQDHINTCLVNAVETGDKKVLEDLNSAIDQFIK
jgi:DNA-binding FrmR family transcriptional regulator